MKMLIRTVLVLITIGLIAYLILIFIGAQQEEKLLSTNKLSFIQDSTWSVSKKSDELVVLKHLTGGELTIKIIELNLENEFVSLEELSQKTLKNIEEQNPSYKLIAKEQTTLLKKQLLSFKTLYEKEKEQVLVLISREENNLVVVTFKAPMESYDLLLDSVYYQINNLEIIKKIDNVQALKVQDLKKITWQENKEFTELLNKTKEYEIAFNHRMVKYTFPDIFTLKILDVWRQEFYYKEDKSNYLSKKIESEVNILKTNIDYLINSDVADSLNYNVNVLKKSKYKKAKNINVELEKINKKEESYIYKISYEEDSKKNTDYYILFKLDERRTLQFKFMTTDFVLPKEIIDKINIVSNEEYAQYFFRNINPKGYLENTLKSWVDSLKNEEYYEIKISVPKNYYEYNRGTMVDIDRKLYGTNYDEETASYKINVHYEIDDSFKYFLKSPVNIINYKEVDKLTHLGSINLHGKKFERYKADYKADVDYKEYSFSDTILVYEINESKHFVITINNRDGIINTDMLRKVSLLEINIKNIEGS